MNKQTEFHDVHAVNDGLFSTQSGVLIDIRKPTPAMIRIEDIALALGNYCRFGGHVSRFYSVAQHSVLVSRMAPGYLKKAALIHDFAEAYLGDVIKPLKVILGANYKELEHRFEVVIHQRFEVHLNQGVKDDIAKFDRKAVEIEDKAFKAGDYHDFAEHMRRLCPDEPMYWNQRYAKMRLLLEFKTLFGADEQ